MTPGFLENFCTHSSAFPNLVMDSIIEMASPSEHRRSILVSDFTRRRPKFNTIALFVVSKIFLGKILLPEIRVSPVNYHFVVQSSVIKDWLKRLI
jgi:hypothetical protein